MHLKGEKTLLAKALEGLKGKDIFLQSLTLESNNSGNSTATDFDNSVFEKYLIDICDNITEFQLINFKIEKENFTKIIDFLKKKLERSKKFDTGNTVKIPLKKLAFRKVKDSGAEINVDLELLYSLFDFIIKMYGGINRFENVFEMLDLSGSQCTNVDSLVNIIKSFKIIKELNLSNTRYIDQKEKDNAQQTIKSNNKQKQNSNVIHNFLINSPNFLPVILRDDEVKEITPFHPILSVIYLNDSLVNKEAFTNLLKLFKVK